MQTVDGFAVRRLGPFPMISACTITSVLSQDARINVCTCNVCVSSSFYLIQTCHLPMKFLLLYISLLTRPVWIFFMQGLYKGGVGHR